MAIFVTRMPYLALQQESPCPTTLPENDEGTLGFASEYRRVYHSVLSSMHCASVHHRDWMSIIPTPLFVVLWDFLCPADRYGVPTLVI